MLHHDDMLHHQARRQDSVTGRAEANFGGAREVYLCKFEKCTGARKIYSSVVQTNKVKTKKKKVFSSNISTNSGYRLKILAIFHDFLSEDQKNKNKKGLRPRTYMKSAVSPQKLRKFGR